MKTQHSPTLRADIQDPFDSTFEGLILPDTENQESKRFNNLSPFDARSSIANSLKKEALSAHKPLSPLSISTPAAAYRSEPVFGKYPLVSSHAFSEIWEAFRRVRCGGILTVTPRSSSDSAVVAPLLGSSEACMITSSRSGLVACRTDTLVNELRRLPVLPMSVIPIFLRAPTVHELQAFADCQRALFEKLRAPIEFLPGRISEANTKGVRLTVWSASTEVISEALDHEKKLMSSFLSVITALAKEIRKNDKVRIFLGKDPHQLEREVLLLIQRTSVDFFREMYATRRGLLERVGLFSPKNQHRVPEADVGAYAESLRAIREEVLGNNYSSHGRQKGQVASQAPQVAPRVGQTDKEAVSNYRIQMFVTGASLLLAEYVSAGGISSGWIQSREYSIASSTGE